MNTASKSGGSNTKKSSTYCQCREVVFIKFLILQLQLTRQSLWSFVILRNDYPQIIPKRGKKLIFGKKKPLEMLNFQGFLGIEICPRRDLNPHAVAGSGF